MISRNMQATTAYAKDIENIHPLEISWISFRDFLLAHRRYPVIAITGQSWVGKSTFTDIFIENLTKKLQSEFPINSPVIKKNTELPQLSPYLPIIIASRDNLIDQTVWEKNQDFFRVLDEAILHKVSLESKDSIIVMDFSIIQVLIYALLKIKWRAWINFVKTFNKSFSNLPKPDFLIHISAKSETVLRRIQARWTFIDDQIQKHTEEMQKYFSENWRNILAEYYDGIPIISVPTDSLDFVNNQNDKDFSTQQAVNNILMRIVT